MNESEISRTVAYLAEVQQAFEWFRGLAGALRAVGYVMPFTPLKELEPLTREAEGKVKAERRAPQTEQEEAEALLHQHLFVLPAKVFALWDAMACEQDNVKKTRLEGLAAATVEWMGVIGRCLGSQYDTLCADDTPRESPDRSHCRPRREYEKEAAEIEGTEPVWCPEEAMADLPCKDFASHDNQELAWAVHVSYRVGAELRHWICEQLTGKVLHYYVYCENPCQRWLTAIELNMDRLITHWRYHNPELSKDLNAPYKALRAACRKADRWFKHLSILPYWNDANYNPIKAKQCGITLHDKMIEIAARDLEKLGQKPNGPGQAGGPRETVTETTVGSKPPALDSTREIPDDAMLSPAKMAEVFAVDYQALRKRLERLRKKDHNCFIENEGRKSTDAKYLYRVGAARPIIRDLKASSSTSSKRPPQE